MRAGIIHRLIVQRNSIALTRLAGRPYTDVAVNASVGGVEQAQGLNAAQFALANRIGIQGIPAPSLKSAFEHPAVITALTADSQENFTAHMNTGRAVLSYFVREYVQCRFPRLPKDSRTLAFSIYEADKNLAAIAKSIGLEYSLIRFQGIPRIKMLSLQEYLDLVRDTLKSKEPKRKPNQVLAETLLALIGVIAERDLAAARRFLDAYLFTCTFDTGRLVKPKYPIVQLSQALQAQGRDQPAFRLLHESGRTSNSSMFVVTVHAGEETEVLGEGYGPSMNLAEHRAAIEALRKMYLVDVHDASRPSDALMHSPSVITLDEIVRSQGQETQ